MERREGGERGRGGKARGKAKGGGGGREKVHLNSSIAVRHPMNDP